MKLHALIWFARFKISFPSSASFEKIHLTMFGRHKQYVVVRHPLTICWFTSRAILKVMRIGLEGSEFCKLSFSYSMSSLQCLGGSLEMHSHCPNI
jgi:hypothetical protein